MYKRQRMWYNGTEVINMTEKFKTDRPFIEGKYHKTTEPFDPFSRMSYHGWDADKTTGLDDGEMRAALGSFLSSLTDTNHAVIKAKAFAFVLDHMRFSINEHDYFPCFWNWSRPLNKLTIEKWVDSRLDEKTSSELKDAVARGEVTCWIDYDHSVPDWDALYSLGFAGIKSRAGKYREGRELSESQKAYFDSIEIEYSAILRLIGRLKDYAAAQSFEKAAEIRDCLSRLESGAPETLYDRLMLIYLYFMLSESVDSYQVRSLGSGIDHDLDGVFRADLEAGIPEEHLNDLVAYFLMQFSSIGNYWGQPTYLGGTNSDGSTRVCEMSYRFLEIYDELGIYNPKIQIKYGRNTPERFLKTVLDMIRRGHSSFVFVCDDNIIKSYLERGVSYENCFDYDVKGCYEYALRGKEFSTAPFYINLLAPVVRVLENSDDQTTCEEIEKAYMAELDRLFGLGIRVCDSWEKNLAEINPAPMLSATITASLEKGRDAYYDGAVLDTTAFVVGAIASGVDALMAVKELVFDKKLVTFGKLKEILKSDWSDERLRKTALNAAHKFGRGDAEADKLAAKIADKVASYQMIPNVRGGYYKVTMHSARQFIEQGRKIPATPDGRLSGEETSKNASPVQGMDREGVTALIRSALALKPSRFYEGFGFDVMIHESAAKGDDGLEAMLGLLRAYANGGGSSIQFNVTSSETLRAAQENPEKYKNLQIRVCGWNILWNDMPRSEQEKYIERAMNI